jgi:hypothetical protein
LARECEAHASTCEALANAQEEWTRSLKEERARGETAKVALQTEVDRLQARWQQTAEIEVRHCGVHSHAAAPPLMFGALGQAEEEARAEAQARHMEATESQLRGEVARLLQELEARRGEVQLLSHRDEERHVAAAKEETELRAGKMEVEATKAEVARLTLALEATEQEVERLRERGISGP